MKIKQGIKEAVYKSKDSELDPKCIDWKHKKHLLLLTEVKLYLVVG